MSQEANAIRDLAHAPLAYVAEALEKGQKATAQLEKELDALEADNICLRRVGEAAQSIFEAALSNPGKRITIWDDEFEALTDALAALERHESGRTDEEER